MNLLFSHFGFADDIVIISDNLDKIKAMLKELETTCKQYG